MSYLDWTADLDVGVDAMNGEHQRLIALMNEFHELSEHGAPRTQCVEALKALGKYTVKHFAHEEAVMKQMGFPELDKHARIHKRLLEQFDEHATSFQESGHAQDLLMFLKVWLKAHIKGIDTKYGQFSQRQSA